MTMKEDLRQKLLQKLERKTAKHNMMSAQIAKRKAGDEEYDLFLNVQEKDEPFSNRDLFENDEYKVFFESSIWEEYEDFVYYIQRGRHDKVLEIARRESIDPNEIIRPSGDTVLHVCAEFGRLQMFEFFAKKGGNHAQRNYASEIPFHIAAREGKMDILQFYLANFDMDIDIKMTDGWTAFHYAAFNGYTATMEYLADNGSNVNNVDRFKRTALHWAARFDNKLTVEKLLKMKINYMAQDVEGNTAFDIARNKKYYEVSCLINDFHISKSKDRARKIEIMKNSRSRTKKN